MSKSNDVDDNWLNVRVIIFIFFTFTSTTLDFSWFNFVHIFTLRVCVCVYETWSSITKNISSSDVFIALFRLGVSGPETQAHIQCLLHVCMRLCNDKVQIFSLSLFICVFAFLCKQILRHVFVCVCVSLKIICSTNDYLHAKEWKTKKVGKKLARFGAA